MLDPDDEQIIRDCKAGGAVLVTGDRWMKEAAPDVVMSPHEAMQKGVDEAPHDAPPEAVENLKGLIRMTPEQLIVMGKAGNETWKMFDKYIKLNKRTAKLVRHLRVQQHFTWRAVARRCALLWEGPWGANQIAGMTLCQKAAKLLGEDFMKEPWN